MSCKILTFLKIVISQISQAIENKTFVPSQMMLHSYPLPTKADESAVDWMVTYLIYLTI